MSDVEQPQEPAGQEPAAEAPAKEKKAKAPKPPKEDKKGDAKAKDGGKSKDGGKGKDASKGKGKGKDAEPEVPAPPPRLMERYEKEILPALAQKLGRTNRHALPKLLKITVNMGVGAATSEKKYLEEAVDAMKLITGQKPVVTKARKSIAGFKLREGMPIGCKVTLRGKRMYEFLDRLIALALPRVRDFRGLNPNAFDGRGNYSIGLTEQLVFPELNPDKYTRPQGMNITLVTSAVNNEDARELLLQFRMPMRTA